MDLAKICAGSHADYSWFRGEPSPWTVSHALTLLSLIEDLARILLRTFSSRQESRPPNRASDVRGLRLHAQYLMAVRSRQLAKSLVGCLGFQDSPSHGARTVIGENSLFHSLTLASSGSEAKWPISPHDRSLTSVAQKPRLVIEQATSSYSFRGPSEREHRGSLLNYEPRLLRNRCRTAGA